MHGKATSMLTKCVLHERFINNWQQHPVRVTYVLDESLMLHVLQKIFCRSCVHYSWRSIVDGALVSLVRRKGGECKSSSRVRGHDEKLLLEVQIFRLAAGSLSHHWHLLIQGGLISLLGWFVSNALHAAWHWEDKAGSRRTVLYTQASRCTAVAAHTGTPLWELITIIDFFTMKCTVGRVQRRVIQVMQLFSLTRVQWLAIHRSSFNEFPIMASSSSKSPHCDYWCFDVFILFFKLAIWVPSSDDTVRTHKYRSCGNDRVVVSHRLVQNDITPMMILFSDSLPESLWSLDNSVTTHFPSAI
jgi:hypothetical protein